MDRALRTHSPMDRLDDAALLVAVGLGDESAAAVFVRRFQSQVYGLAVTMCADGRLAEDIAQSTFERAWRHAGSFDPRLGSVRTWLLTICRRLAIDALRVRRAVPLDPEGFTALLPPSAEPDPIDVVVVGDEVDRIRRVVLRMPEPQRRALLLAAFGGHTAKEIASIEHIPLGTAKSRLRAGLIHVRDLLRESQPVVPATQGPGHG